MLRPRRRRCTLTSRCPTCDASTLRPTREADGRRTTDPPRPVESKELAESGASTSATGDQALRDRLILTYAPLVKYVAGRLGTGLPAHVEEGDLVSYGLLGLIGAIERYEPDRDVKFETYAIARIKGSIIDELRSLDWVPRSVRSRAREIERAMVELENRLKRAPTDEEIAAEVGITRQTSSRTT